MKNCAWLRQKDRKQISISFTPDELAEMKRMIEKHIPGTILRTEDTACPACNAPIDDARFQHYPFCGQRLNWVALPQESTDVANNLFVRTPSDLLDFIETQNLESAVTANRLINFFGSFHAIFEASPEELCQVDGMSPSAATLIASLLPTYRLYAMDKYARLPHFKVYSDLAAYCRNLFTGSNNEMCYLLCFDAGFHLLATELINRGTPCEVNVHPRMALEIAMRHHATSVVLTHNHPSGNPEPSDGDCILTEQVREAFAVVEIRLFDHVIIANDEDFSMRANQRKGS